MELNRSGLYDCEVVHARTWPKPHKLRYRFFWFALDLEEAETHLPVYGWVGTGILSLYRFCTEDHLCFESLPQETLRQKLRRYLASQAVQWDGSRAVLVTQLRFFGYVFNPVSFYYCWNADGSPAACVAEVGNTYGEMKLYLLGSDPDGMGRFHRRVAKHFYVSPFTDLQTEFDFLVGPPTERFLADVNDYRGGERILCASLSGRRVPLSKRWLVFQTLRFPFITFQIIFLIHWNALLLWFKGIPYFSKHSNMQDQREVLRPHQEGVR